MFSPRLKPAEIQAVVVLGSRQLFFAGFYKGYTFDTLFLQEERVGILFPRMDGCAIDVTSAKHIDWTIKKY